MLRTFDISEVAGQKLILCRICCAPSFNHEDIRARYCANCDTHHERFARYLNATRQLYWAVWFGIACGSIALVCGVMAMAFGNWLGLIDWTMAGANFWLARGSWKRWKPAGRLWNRINEQRILRKQPN